MNQIENYEIDYLVINNKQKESLSINDFDTQVKIEMNIVLKEIKDGF